MNNLKNSSAYEAKIVTDYLKLFRGLSDIQGEYQIKSRDDAQPFALNVPRKSTITISG